MLASDSIYLLMLGSGLLGGLGHCSGMCGPIVATYALNLSAALWGLPVHLQA
ncbi:MAG: sulfite exporter TauE/SafE family protein [Nitrospirae bacterium]|nr:sulfite exporter TauE/SafE family protein [Nitrospirota bacterium]